MNKTILVIGSLLAFVACDNGQQTTKTNEEHNHQEHDESAMNHEENAEESDETVSYPYYAGAEFDESLAITPAELVEKRNAFEGDSMEVVLAANINECCKKKGCWMTIDLENGEEMMVRFRDYDFFVPLNADGRSTVLKGKVFNDTIDVAMLQHYAEDAGASADSIAKITEPQVSFSFLADGVVVK